MLRGWIAASLFAGALVACNREPLDTAPGVDLERFQGKWHEIAHFARATQNDCTGTTATYSRKGDGTLTFVHECTLKTGGYHGATAIARVDDPTTPAKMTVDFGGHLGDYWIIETAADYRYAVVGHPSRDYLWILSRAPAMTPEDLDVVLSHARASGFDTNRLEYTPPGPEPEGAPAPPVEYGCAAAPHAGDFATAAFPFLGVLIWWRRAAKTGRRRGSAARTASRAR